MDVAEVERLPAEGEAEPPGGIPDGGPEVADGGVAADAGPAAVGEGGEPLLVYDVERDPDGLDGDLQVEVGEDKGVSFLSRGEEVARGGGDEGVGIGGVAEREGEVLDPDPDPVGEIVRIRVRVRVTRARVRV